MRDKRDLDSVAKFCPIYGERLRDPGCLFIDFLSRQRWRKGYRYSFYGNAAMWIVFIAFMGGLGDLLKSWITDVLAQLSRWNGLEDTFFGL